MNIDELLKKEHPILSLSSCNDDEDYYPVSLFPKIDWLNVPMMSLVSLPGLNMTCDEKTIKSRRGHDRVQIWRHLIRHTALLRR